MNIADLVAGYDRIYQHVDAEYSFDVVQRWVKQYTSIMDYVGGTVLDVGCGVGDWSLGLSFDFKVTGIDISSVAIEKARAKSNRIKFIVGDVFDLEGKFDIVFCRGPSFFNRPPDGEYEKRLSRMLALTEKLYVYITATAEPYGDGEAWYKHDPKIIGEMFQRYGESKVRYADSYLIGEIYLA